MRRGLDHLDTLARYSTVSNQLAQQVIGAYSTSFGMATRLLGQRHRAHVQHIYALVRVADELVDGATAEAGADLAEQHRLLDLLEAETESAMALGYSSNPIVQAFSGTARCAGIDSALTRPFFSSMRTDLRTSARANLPTDPSPAGTAPDPARTPPDHADTVPLSRAEHATYVYGSAEVVGLMCLRVFMRGLTCTAEEEQRLEHGARSLGAAFQNANFLRDLGDDTLRLGRNYLGGAEGMNEQSRDRWITVIRRQLEDAARVIPLLPRDARWAVRCALRLFSALAERLGSVPIDELVRRRVRVSTPKKAVLVLRAALDDRRAQTT